MTSPLLQDTFLASPGSSGMEAIAQMRDSGKALTPSVLGDAGFRADHGVRYAYAAGAMGNGIASEEWVIRLARSGIDGLVTGHRARILRCR